LQGDGLGDVIVDAGGEASHSRAFEVVRRHRDDCRAWSPIHRNLISDSFAPAKPVRVS
jgi:hypothetical protein